MNHVELAQTGLIGGGATACMDLWTLLLRQCGVQAPDYALVGRWIGHMRHGRFAHASIRGAAAVAHERALGWATHYIIGVAFAGLLVAVAGTAWLAQPTLMPAMLVGLGTVFAPLLLMQPAMGLGIASSRTPRPWRSVARSLANHAAFGLGLYISAAAIARVVA